MGKPEPRRGFPPAPTRSLVPVLDSCSPSGIKCSPVRLQIPLESRRLIGVEGSLAWLSNTSRTLSREQLQMDRREARQIDHNEKSSRFRLFSCPVTRSYRARRNPIANVWWATLPCRVSASKAHRPLQNTSKGRIGGHAAGAHQDQIRILQFRFNEQHGKCVSSVYPGRNPPERGRSTRGCGRVLFVQVFRLGS